VRLLGNQFPRERVPRNLDLVVGVLVVATVVNKGGRNSS
jgi:hypothetical protein